MNPYLPAAELEDGAQNFVPVGDRLGAAGVRHILQTGDRCRHPVGEGSTSTGHIQAPGGGRQRSGLTAGLCGGGDAHQPTRGGPLQRGRRQPGGNRGEDRD